MLKPVEGHLYNDIVAKLNNYIFNKYGVDNGVNTFPYSTLAVLNTYKPEIHKFLIEKYHMLMSDRLFQIDKKSNKIVYDKFDYDYVGETTMIFECDSQIYLVLSLYGESVCNVEFVYKESRGNIDKINNILELINGYAIISNAKTKSRILKLSVGHMGNLTFKTKEIKKPKYKLDDNYNDDVVERFPEIIKNLKKEGGGILYLKGEPGTGKTSFIRFIVDKLKNQKNFLFISSQMGRQLGSPDFMNLIDNYPDSIILLEEGDNILKSRKDHEYNTDVISNILSMTDGLETDYNNIKFIVTMNSEIDEIDEALRRKGRVIDILDFKPLNKEKANKLAKKLNKDFSFEKDIVLADIYKSDLVSYKKEIKKIGF